MSAGGTRRSDSDEWADGGRRPGAARPRYLSLMAPSRPAPDGHHVGARRAGIGARPQDRSRQQLARTAHADPRTPQGLLVVAALILEGALAVSATALLVWLLWRLAVSLAGG